MCDATCGFAGHLSPIGEKSQRKQGVLGEEMLRVALFDTSLSKRRQVVSQI